MTTFTYTPTGRVGYEVKPNGNTVDDSYFADNLLAHQLEAKPDGATVAEHTYTYTYTSDGDKASDAEKLMNADNTTAYLTHTLGYSYDPRDRITTVTKDGATTESYTHDANDNVTDQSLNGTPTTFKYDRNRLLTATTNGAAAGYNYDPFGRLDTVTSGGTVVQSSTYDGFDHIVSHQQRNATGGMDTTSYTYDPLDRKTSQTTAGKTTSYAYLGLSSDLITESSGGSVAKSYTYTPPGLRLSQTTHNSDGTTTPGYYTYNDHNDVEAVTGAAGNTTATYGYTAYGQDDKNQFTGADKTAAQPGSQPFNPYRFNAMRWDSATTQYDMGFRIYDPGLNQFLSRDMYEGAVDDMGLDTDPFTGNRYTFGAGNPISNIELDGHVNTAATAGGCDSSLPGCPGYRAPASAPASSPDSGPRGCIGPRNPLPVPCSALHQGNALPWLWKKVEDLTGITAAKACVDHPSLGPCTMAALQILADVLALAKGTKIVGALLRPALRALGLLGKGTEAGSAASGSLRVIGSGFSASERGAAAALAAQGRNVVLREATGIGRTSDLLVNGIPYDVYTPTTGNLDRIAGAIASKGSQVNGGGVVLDLSKSPLSAADVGNILPRVQGISSQISDIIVMGG